MDKLNKLNSGQPRQRKGKGTARDVKKKVLAERRKPLNIDHMDLDKLKQKVTELYDYLSTLENERADFETDNDEKKYEMSTLRYRVNMLSGAASKEKTKRIGRIGVKK
ncbi:Oidioi.mRNA.OKI2018_I69.PAR.g11659.t1.cds [Oikopleura dioica]|uniref:Oidioi.mRNA.OKI2018_I69.PAR.g11659.t1.cds n=1 Tax=Oikopleura dioica TaxID=34765 RepID=A0ABN7S1H0_OIKDI|nr:Oidioi.mRNA.OKI2018_I69.PAR.g11659.t1.cds [Oikopleura dioica]